MSGLCLFLLIDNFPLPLCISIPSILGGTKEEKYLNPSSLNLKRGFYCKEKPSRKQLLFQKIQNK